MANIIRMKLSKPVPTFPAASELWQCGLAREVDELFSPERLFSQTERCTYYYVADGSAAKVTSQPRKRNGTEEKPKVAQCNIKIVLKQQQIYDDAK